MAKYTWQPDKVVTKRSQRKKHCQTPANDADVDVTVLSVLENTHG